jgi:hypothetical protein
MRMSGKVLLLPLARLLMRQCRPKPFIWTKSADDILAGLKRFCLATLKTAEIQVIMGETSESGH